MTRAATACHRNPEVNPWHLHRVIWQCQNPHLAAITVHCSVYKMILAEDTKIFSLHQKKLVIVGLRQTEGVDQRSIARKCIIPRVQEVALRQGSQNTQVICTKTCPCPCASGKINALEYTASLNEPYK